MLWSENLEEQNINTKRTTRTSRAHARSVNPLQVVAERSSTYVDC